MALNSLQFVLSELLIIPVIEAPEVPDDPLILIQADCSGRGHEWEWRKDPLPLSLLYSSYCTKASHLLFLCLAEIPRFLDNEH